ncbi:GGDEF domain-containing protein [Ammoniphilus sp. YIM 78166]|uniref:GGDEF domain-containing protein n=1 Tax=Ammoniphilus sp. YIM 78166 TaxID=1644106 RepID=UPI00106F9C8E|nr:GGDEF domain-containing protein [Ammoniphilus sp. YIM 78166]
MESTGRILGLLLAIALSIGVNGYFYLRLNHFDLGLFFMLPILLFLGWFLGRQYDRVRYLSEKDVLTETYNRRFIHEMFPKLIALTERKNETMAVTLIDVDNFKCINDTYGHQTGDLVLQRISQLLSKQVRSSDTIARWGGDEFLVIAPFTDRTGSASLLQRISESIGELSSELKVPITLSMGTSIFPLEGKELTDLIEVADQRMYKHKQKGVEQDE